MENRDVIILEQRGNRYTEPSLTCDMSVWWEEVEGHTPCLDSLKAQGIDLTQYNTAVITQDIDALRQTLEYEKWNLYGSSYSTRLMQLTMALHPDGIRSVLLSIEKTSSHSGNANVNSVYKNDLVKYQA